MKTKKEASDKLLAQFAGLYGGDPRNLNNFIWDKLVELQMRVDHLERLHHNTEVTNRKCVFTVLIADEEAGFTGGTEAVSFKPHILVTRDFHTDAANRLGMARVYWEGTHLKAEFFFPAAEVPVLYPAINGVILQKERRGEKEFISKCNIRSIALCDSPNEDKRIPPIVALEEL